MARMLTPEERALWKNLTEGIRRHEDGRVSAPLKKVLQRTKQRPTSFETKNFAHEIGSPSSSASEQQRIVEAAYGHMFGVEHLRQNKAKTIWPEATLDLHGLTRAQATIQLQRFFFESQRKNRVWVKVITGKSGIFFSLAPQFLKDNGPFVSGYLHARANDGGTGALYVRIRRR